MELFSIRIQRTFQLVSTRYVYTEPSGLCQYDGCGSFLPGPRQVPALGYLSGPFLSFAHITNGLHVYGCF